MGEGQDEGAVALGDPRRFYVLASAFLLGAVWFLLDGEPLVAALAAAEAAPFVVLAKRASHSLISVRAEDGLRVLLPSSLPWTRPLEARLGLGGYVVVRHLGWWVGVPMDVVLLEDVRSGDQVKVNSVYFRRRDWSRVHEAIVAHQAT